MDLDMSLAERARSGDAEAFAQIYVRYRDNVYNYCLSYLLGHRQAADDATAETFLAVIDGRLRGYDPARPLVAWLLGVARNKARDQARKSATHRELEPSEPEIALRLMAAAGDDDVVAAEDARRLVSAAAAALDNDDRHLLALYLQECAGKLTRDELAGALGLGVDHANVRVSRLRQRLSDAVLTLVLTRPVPDQCPVVAALGATVTPLLRKRVAGHARSCSACGKRGRKMLSAQAILAAVPFLAAPAVVARRVWPAAAAPAALSMVDIHLPSATPAAGAWIAKAAGALIAAVLATSVLAADSPFSVPPGAATGPGRPDAAAPIDPVPAPTPTPVETQTSPAPQPTVLPSAPVLPPATRPSAGAPMWGYASTREQQHDAPLGQSLDLHTNWQWSTARTRFGEGPYTAMVRTGTGRYAVRMPGIGAAQGIAHTSIANWGYYTADTCQLTGSRVDGPDQIVEVACFDAAGAPKNLPFQVVFTRPSSAGGLLSARYDAAATDSRVTRTGPGRYTFTSPGVHSGHGYARITAVGNERAVCRPASVAPGLTVSIACDSAGIPTDTGWMLSYTEHAGLLGEPAAPAGYATIASNVVDGARSWSTNNELPSVSRTSPGTYDLWYQGLGRPAVYPGDAVDVTAIGPDARYCRTQAWNSYSFPPKVRIIILCFDGSGVRADASFALSYVRAP